ncbi:MAG: DUF4350 domain-containing protein, partial [Mucilaginibacter polytrichastri]|nr:DUF4350 domain-containing protein [Mucilaginibacter polytrichastri]
PDLRWAWYLASGILLLFVLAEVKRRQRAIPVLVPPANRSLEFVNVVGQVYYEEHNNADLAAKMGLYFHEYLRTRFELQLQPDDPKFAELLARKSNMDAALVKNLLAQVNYAQQAPQITDKELIELNTLLENFYKETR